MGVDSKIVWYLRHIFPLSIEWLVGLIENELCGGDVFAHVVSPSGKQAFRHEPSLLTVQYSDMDAIWMHLVFS